MQQLVQPFPTAGVLFRNLDRSRAELNKLVRRDLEGQVYSYVVNTVKFDRLTNQFRQGGSAPNFQGGCITLCTCKHQMRATLDVKEWPRKWVAGLSSRKYDGNHWLIYLARIESAYESHAELWLKLDESIRQAKSARQFRLGDLYEPRRPLNGKQRFDLSAYHPPVSCHVHSKSWRIDIDYRRKKLKRKPRLAPLLIGDRQLTFLWKEPALHLVGNHARNRQKWETLSEFLKQLRSGNASFSGSASTRGAAGCKARC